MSLQTEYPFTLPKGFVDEQGTLHRDRHHAPGLRPRRDRAAA